MRPRDPNNIGSVARAMKNFGFHDLWVVAPHPPVWNEITSAPNAEDVLTNARVVATLAEAIADRTLVAGTTDPTRAESKQTLYTPMDLAGELRERDERLALVFGSEKHGLTNEDLSRCHRVMSIPTEANCPSMNLGQAVAVCCYELTCEAARQAIAPLEPERATAGAMEAALQLSLETFGLIDFILPGNEPELSRRLRGTLMRLNLSARDVDLLCGVLSRIRRALKTG
ncbi:MAG: RNA methyltransferase [Blastocatellia bacterium]